MSETTSDPTISPDNLPRSLVRCAVCQDTLIRPRIMQCGHSFCTHCHIQLDEHAESASRPFGTRRDSVVTFTCPICRATTHTPWHMRPLNHVIMGVIDEMLPVRRPFESKEDDDDGSTDGTPDLGRRNFDTDVDLHSLLGRSRQQIANSLYQKILDELYTAALNGRHSVTFNSKEIIDRSEYILDLIAQYLFENNNVYKIEMNRAYSALTVHIGDYVVQRSYVNQNANSRLSSATNFPSISPLARTRSIADAVREVARSVTSSTSSSPRPRLMRPPPMPPPS